MQESPMISVIIPVYNTEEHLPQCFDSVINQTYKNIEIIVVNDGSTDHSLSIIQDYSQKDTRIKLIDKKNGGLSSARNAGIKVAIGDYVLHVDSDDWIELDTCEKLLESAIKHNSQIVVSDVFFETNNRTFVRKEPYSEIEDKTSFFRKYLLHTGLNSVCNKLFSLALYKENNLFHYEDISLGEDATTLLRLVVMSSCISYVDQPFYHYNMRSSGMSRGIKKNIMQYYNGLKKVENFYLQKNLSTDLFPLIRFKVAYSELVNCGLRKARVLGYTDYQSLAKLFIDDINNIKSNVLYKDYKFKYKLFIFLYKIYYTFIPRTYR